jgi:hypothetical protein
MSAVSGKRLSVVAVWLVLLVLLAAILLTEYSRRPRRDTEGEADPRARMLLPVPLEQVGAIEVAHAGAVHRFERDEKGVWFYHGAHAASDATHGHTADPAMARQIETGFAMFSRTRMERQLPLDKGGQEYGVATPQTLILVYRPKELQPLAQFAVGDVAPDAVSRYVLVVGSSNVVTIPAYQIDGLLELIKAAESGPKPVPASAKSS